MCFVISFFFLRKEFCLTFYELYSVSLQGGTRLLVTDSWASEELAFFFYIFGKVNFPEHFWFMTETKFIRRSIFICCTKVFMFLNGLYQFGGACVCNGTFQKGFCLTEAQGLWHISANRNGDREEINSKMFWFLGMECFSPSPAARSVL